MYGQPFPDILGDQIPKKDNGDISPVDYDSALFSFQSPYNSLGNPLRTHQQRICIILQQICFNEAGTYIGKVDL